MREQIGTAILIGFLMAGCEYPQKKLVGNYALERFDENQKYYVIDSRNDLSGGGVFDGTIEKIGWNQDWILAQVFRLSHGDTNGWYALNLKTKEILGPLEDSDIKTNLFLSKIKTLDAQTVFSGGK